MGTVKRREDGLARPWSLWQEKEFLLWVLENMGKRAVNIAAGPKGAKRTAAGFLSRYLRGMSLRYYGLGGRYPITKRETEAMKLYCQDLMRDFSLEKGE